MRYKLINNNTKEEHLCDKVTIDGFDYYLSDFINNIGSYINEYGKPIVKFIKDLGEDLLWESIDGKSSSCDSKIYFKTVIATTNPNIDVTKVVDTVEELALSYEMSFIDDDGTTMVDFIAGYNKSQETHPFSLEDMIEFGKFCESRMLDSSGKFLDKTLTELLQFWKAQRIKTIYYE